MKLNFNENFTRLSENYLFSEVARRVERLKSTAPDSKKSFFGRERIISLGIGDVTLPIPTAVSQKMARAALEMSGSDTFRGYGDTQGHLPLREALCRRYAERGVQFSADEIFINDGAKSDLGNLNDLFGRGETLITEPTYPVYLDAAVMAGREVKLLCANKENSFLPMPDALDFAPRVIYLCSPNNPTGAVFDKDGLQKWVNFARESGSVIIFDAAYEAFVEDDSIPHSIFEIEGAKLCAIEVCSFSKMAGFTGVRCGWTAIARENPLHAMWKRRQSAKFNGASYIAQIGALASLEEGRKECAKNVKYYMENAHILADFLTKKGVFFTGGIHAPYLWVECPNNEPSWHFFDRLLNTAHIVCTPGAGFGGGDLGELNSARVAGVGNSNSEYSSPIRGANSDDANLNGAGFSTSNFVSSTPHKTETTTRECDRFVRFSSFAPREDIKDAAARLDNVF